MSTNATDPTTTAATTEATAVGAQPTQASDKGKGKAPATEDNMDEDEEDEEDEDGDDDDGAEDSSEDEGDESLDAIDASAILPRRTRGAKVDYTSEEALAKAGLDKAEDEDDDDDDVKMKD